MAENANPPAGAVRAPTRFAAAIDDCEVVGRIPAELDGAFYRVGGEWYYPPKFRDDAPLNADGYVSMFRLKDGKADFRGRFIETHRFKEQRKARRQLYGQYRNPYTDDPSVQDPSRPALRTVSNTAPFAHAGKLFSLKEDGLPYQLDPNTLETLGTYDYDGKWTSQTYTAHPKIDALSGEVVTFGYEATGLLSDDVFVGLVDKAGKLRHQSRIKVPYVSVMHDMAITHKHILFPFGGYVTSEERLKAGKVHWGWDQTKPSYIGVMRREGDGRDIRWFKGPERCLMHVFNAYDDGNKIVLYAPFYDGNFFPFFAPVDGSPWDPSKARGFFRKITLDLNSRKDTWQEEILWPTPIVDLGKVDPRTVSLQSRYLYTSYTDASKPLARDRMLPNAPARMVNSYLRFDVQTGKAESWFAGPTHNLEEVSFVPTGREEGQGYLVGLCTNWAENRAEMVIVDAQRMADGEVARVLLPWRVSSQVHGVWAGRDELPLA